MVNISVNTKIAGVIGDPISHSLSPKIHNYLIKKYQIDGLYLPFKVEPQNLGSTVKTFAYLGLRGFNVTLPHKEKMVKICDHLSKSALDIGAVNTVIITPDRKLFGHNSDGVGFINNIKYHAPNFNFKGKNIVVLGAGGATRAVIYALLQEEVKKIVISNRSSERAQILINDFAPKFKKSELNFVVWEQKESALKDCDLLINCTSLGMVGREKLAIDLTALNKEAIVTDIVYQPLMTDFLVDAQKHGHKIVTGIGMLINQALIGFEAWYGVKPEVDEELINSLKITA